MLGAIMMIVMIGALAYVFMGCVAVSGFGGSSTGVTIVAVGCVIGIFMVLWNAQAIVGMKIAISFGG
ncbi:MAG: hypothetical protein ACRDDH_11735 [Cetobacterium sp.]|uniref:hypothetical protein n=1 Tax=Cetobacterium sp. TaxID=2071632 RepID=UPI003EE68BDC